MPLSPCALPVLAVAASVPLLNLLLFYGDGLHRCTARMVEVASILTVVPVPSTQAGQTLRFRVSRPRGWEEGGWRTAALPHPCGWAS